MSQPDARVLIADDQPDVRRALKLLLAPEGFEVEEAASPAAALAALEAGDFDAALIDLNYARDTTSGREGLERLEAMLHEGPRLGRVEQLARVDAPLSGEPFDVDF